MNKLTRSLRGEHLFRIFCVFLLFCMFLFLVLQKPEMRPSNYAPNPSQRVLVENAMRSFVIVNRYLKDDVRKTLVLTGQGSGFIIGNGLVLTVRHNFAPDGEKSDIAALERRYYYEILWGVKKYTASIISLPEDMDVATFQMIPTFGGPMPLLPKVTLGDSDALWLSQPVCAIGVPLTVPSITCGIISQTKQTVKGLKKPLIQTDAAINPGNSGGLLIELEKGTVVGLCNAKMVGEALEGLGFCIPINDIKPLLVPFLAPKRRTGVPEETLAISWW